MRLGISRSSTPSRSGKVQPQDWESESHRVSTPSRHISGKILPDSLDPFNNDVGSEMKEYLTDLSRKIEIRLERQLKGIDSTLFAETQDLTIRLSRVEGE